MSMYGMSGIPLEAQGLYRRGVELSDQMKYEVAVKYLRQAVIIAPRFGGAYRALGRCLEQLGRDSEAQDCFRKFILIGRSMSTARA